MATQTSGDLHLVKPAYSDTADIAVINSNMDTIDTGVTAANADIAKLPYIGDATRGNRNAGVHGEIPPPPRQDEAAIRPGKRFITNGGIYELPYF